MGVWKAYWIGLMAWGAALPACAQWQLIDDFEQWEDGQIFTEATDIGWQANSYPGMEKYRLLRDPWDPDNIGLFVDGWLGDSYANLLITRELPDGGIFPGTTGTLFFRCLWSGIDNNWRLGTSDIPLELDPVTGVQTGPDALEDFNVLIRRFRLNIEHRDGGGYVTTNPPKVLDFNRWYNFWMVIDNTWDNSTVPPTSTGAYTLYVQGQGFGDGISPTLVPVGTDPPKNSAALRRAPADDDGDPRPIIWILFGTNPDLVGCSSCGNPFYLDDFYFSHGTNLSDPTSQNPWGYPWANEAMDIDTGPFLGWLNIAQAPYIWSYALNGWIYMEEPDPEAPGAWAYFFK